MTPVETLLRACLASDRRRTAKGLQRLAKGHLDGLAPLIAQLEADPASAPAGATLRALAPADAQALLDQHPELGEARRGSGAQRTERLTLYLSVDEAAALGVEAERRGQPVATVARELLAAGLGL